MKVTVSSYSEFKLSFRSFDAGDARGIFHIGDIGVHMDAELARKLADVCNMTLLAYEANENKKEELENE